MSAGKPMNGSARRVAGVAKLPAHNLDAEGAVLSALLINADDAFPKVAGILETRHFFSDANRRIYAAVVELRSQARPVDLVTVATELRDREQLAMVGGTPYLAELSDKTPAYVHLDDHARLVHEAWRSRELRNLGHDLVLDTEHGTETRDIIQRAQEALGNIDAPTGGRPPAMPRRGATISDVLTEWATLGPLVHEPTGFARLDELTGGGFPYGTRVYLNGSPDAGKTAFITQMADTHSARGIAVGILAVDEEAGDILTRLSQRIGYARSILEARGESTIESIRGTFGDRPIRFYDDTWTIESAAADLAKFAKSLADADPDANPHGPRALLCIDSVQTVMCDAELAAIAAGGRAMATTEAVTARVRGIRAVATRYRMITVSTSELGRGAYAKSDPDERTANMAGAKWSGAVEYSARILLGIRSAAGEPDVLEVEVSKNKHGPRDETLYLRIDRRSQTLVEIDRDQNEAEGRAAQAADERGHAKVTAAAAQVAVTLATRPGKPTRTLVPNVKARAPALTRTQVEAGLSRLGDAVVEVQGKRNARYLYLDGSKVPADVLVVMTPSDRMLVEDTKPPVSEGSKDDD
jgi:replicative DNA helicase